MLLKDSVKEKNHINKLNLNIKYIDFSPKYLYEMVNLANERLGEGYTDADAIISYVSSLGNICKLAVNSDTDQLLGLFLLHKTNIKDLAVEFKLSEKEIISVTNSDNLCVAKSLVLRKNTEKRGIATEMFRQGLIKAKNMGYYAVWSPLWIRKDKSIPAKHVEEKNGMKFFKIAHKVWEDDLNYKCLDCNGPCVCDAAIYYKIL